MGTERPAGTREAPESSVLRLEAHDSFGPLLAEWDALATASRNVFATSEWARLWWEWFGGPSRLRIIAARHPGGVLAGIVPLMITRVGPVRIARFVGHGTGDLLGPIHEPSCEITGPQLLRQALGKVESEWDAFFGERLPGDAGWSSASGTSEMSQESSPVLPLARWPTWEAYIGSLSRKLRQDLRHDERTLAERHRTRFRMTQDPSRLSSDLDVVFALHRARWDGRSSFVPREEFFRRFAALALERGWLRLWILEADDQPVAARFDFEYAGVYNAYNGGRDPAWSKAGVGLVLRAHTMREAMVCGVSEYRFLRGGESYKKRFLTEDPGLVTIARDRTFLGRCVTRAGALLKHNPRLRWLALPLFRNRRG